MKRWAFALVHAWPSVAGFVRVLFATPGFALRLLKARFIYFCCRKLCRPITTPDGFLIEGPNELISYWSFFVERECWDRQWVQALKTSPRPVVVDVGANAGVFSHWIWTMRPDVDLIAFDPLPRMAAKISRWRERTGARVTVHNKAVSNKAGTGRFYASSEDDTSASLLPKDGKELTVPTVTLDESVPEGSVLLVKVDVEGGECDVLAGGQRVLGNASFLIVEAHSREALEGIKGVLGSRWHSRRVGRSDYLFEAASKAAPV
jgi:FkbM family methyltransferase